MTIKLTGNTLGGTIEANGTPVANVTSTGGFPFCKNKLFNGEVTRINQRGFDGNWATKNTWAVGNVGNIALQEQSYGYDMWAKWSATEMVQVIEAGNFRPSTVHTLSGIGVTTQQITSPASGPWTIAVPFAARNVQVEEGSVATPFEIRPASFELAQCQRYYERSLSYGLSSGSQGGMSRSGSTNNDGNMIVGDSFAVAKRTIPQMYTKNYAYTNDQWTRYQGTTISGATPVAYLVGTSSFCFYSPTLTPNSPATTEGHWIASAVI